jgi:hypothetical protein
MQPQKKESWMLKKIDIKRGKQGFDFIIILIAVTLLSCTFFSTGLDLFQGQEDVAKTDTPDYALTASSDAEAAIQHQQQETEQTASKMTENAMVQERQTQTAVAGLRDTASSKATLTEQARMDAEATQKAQSTDTQTPTPEPTQTNTLPPQPTLEPITSTPAPPSSGTIVRGPGEKSAGDHGVTVRNKTGENVTILMYGDMFNYTFYVPDGNHKIFLRPGHYSFTIYACGGTTTGSGVFNSNWYWEFKCK